MQRELEDRLFECHGDLFPVNARESQDSAMYRGFECGDGWFGLIDAFCWRVQRMMAQGQAPPVTIVQVKEKLGRLCIHFRGGNEEVWAMRELIGDVSERIDQNLRPE